MNPQKVNMDYSLTGSRVDNDGEGLRLLARMIARRLIARKSGANGQHPHPELLQGGVDEKAHLQPPGRAGKKQAATPFVCKPDVLDTLTDEGDEGDGDD